MTPTLPITIATDIVEDALADVRALVRRRIERQARVAPQCRLDGEQQFAPFDEKARARPVFAWAVEVLVDAVREVAFVRSKPRADMGVCLVGHARDGHDGPGNQSPRDLQGPEVAR